MSYKAADYGPLAVISWSVHLSASALICLNTFSLLLAQSDSNLDQPLSVFGLEVQCLRQKLNEVIANLLQKLCL